MKQYSLIINAFAQSDLKMAVDWYAERKGGSDREFIEEIEITIQQIIRNPQQFALVRKKIRMAIVKRFPYGIYYFIGVDNIHVFAGYSVIPENFNDFGRMSRFFE